MCSLVSEPLTRAPLARAPPLPDCARTYDDATPTCAHNSTIYHTQAYKIYNLGSAGNCAHCVCADKYADVEHYDPLSADDPGGDTWGECCDGWNGTSCDICAVVDACPPKMIDGNLTEAKNCTRGALLPTVEEAEHGKRFSCHCGASRDPTARSAPPPPPRARPARCEAAAQSPRRARSPAGFVVVCHPQSPTGDRAASQASIHLQTGAV